MREFIEKLLTLAEPLIRPIANTLKVEDMVAGIILLVLSLAVLGAIITLSVCIYLHARDKSYKRKKIKVKKVKSKHVETKEETKTQPQKEAPAKAESKPEVKAQPKVVLRVVVKENPKSKKEQKKTNEQVKAPSEEKKIEEKPEKKVEAKEKKQVEATKLAPKAEAKIKEPVAKKVEPKVEAKKVEPKVEAKKPAEQKKETIKKPFPGKWVIEMKGAGEYMSKLVASNGEVMLSSEIYSSEEGARQGIATIIKWVAEGNFVIYQDKKNNYYYKLKTAGNRLICVGEIYKAEDQCLKAVESVKRIAPIAIISPELNEGEKYAPYTPQPLEVDDKALKGKWKIEAIENGKFVAKLYASNGQLMIATEEVARKSTALASIESVKKNASEGNFIIDHDKFGRFYYKLRNAQKSVICIGESYDSLDSCVKALESVRRFAVNSILVAE